MTPSRAEALIKLPLGKNCQGTPVRQRQTYDSYIYVFEIKQEGAVTFPSPE